MKMPKVKRAYRQPCARCQKNPRHRSRDGRIHIAYCHSCWKEYNKERNKSEKGRDSVLRSRYGISLEDYKTLLFSQGGVCAICQIPPEKENLFVDHDHQTKAVRGLLCNLCNVALGSMRDNPSFLRAAADYLERG